MAADSPSTRRPHAASARLPWPRGFRLLQADNWWERSGSDEIGTVYEQNRRDALAADVCGSPVYVLDGEVFRGQDRIELLADALKSGRAPYRSQV
jgi:hypothetical protein